MLVGIMRLASVPAPMSFPLPRGEFPASVGSMTADFGDDEIDAPCGSQWKRTFPDDFRVPPGGISHRNNETLCACDGVHRPETAARVRCSWVENGQGSISPRRPKSTSSGYCKSRRRTSCSPWPAVRETSAITRINRHRRALRCPHRRRPKLSLLHGPCDCFLIARTTTGSARGRRSEECQS